MSVDIASLPLWKLALMERKRRQELESMGSTAKTESIDVSVIPPWKQEILFRKQQKGHTGGRNENRRSFTDVLLSPDSGERSCRAVVDPWPVLLSPVRDAPFESSSRRINGHLTNNSFDRNSASNDNDDVPVEEGRLPPIHQNPILLLDLEKRHHFGFVPSLHSPIASELDRNNLAKPSKSRSYINSSEDGIANSALLGQAAEVTDIEAHNEVFNENEVTYGRGFVNRLLQKFTYLSEREEHPLLLFSRSLSRGQSSEDFSRPSTEKDTGFQKSAREKASSLDDILKESKTDHISSQNIAVVNGGVHLQRWNLNKPYSAGDGQAEGSIVLTAKSIFEGLAISPTSSAKKPFESLHSSSPERLPWNQNAQSSLHKLRSESRMSTKQSGSGFNEMLNVSVAQKNTVEIGVKRPAHPPAIISPKPVLSVHAASSQLNEDQSKKASDMHTGSGRGRGGGFMHGAGGNSAAAQVSVNKTKMQSNVVKQDHIKDNVNLNAKESKPSVADVVDSSEFRQFSDKKDVVGTKSSESSASPAFATKNIIKSSQIENKTSISQNSLPTQSYLTSGQSVADIADGQGNSKVQKKSPPSRPGLLLIRPASNLQATKSDIMKMTKYNDIKKGEFAPAKPPPQQENESENDDSDDDTGNFSSYLNVQYEFEGAGVCFGRSLLTKSKHGRQLKIQFDDSATSTYEYPSEQCLIDSMPPEPGDVDYLGGEHHTTGKKLLPPTTHTIPK